MKKLAVVILAAGQGTRMKSNQAKVLHPILGRPMIEYPLAVARSMKPERTVVVVGAQANAVKAALADSGVKFALQKEQLGTGHAVRAALPALKGFTGDVVVLYGDGATLRPETIKALLKKHRGKRATMTLLTAIVDDPFGYGRIIRDEHGQVQEIVEEKDCAPEQRALKEMNPGIYVYDADFLRKTLPKLKANNRQREYYLTDLLGMAVVGGHKVESSLATDPCEILGINSRWELAHVEDLLRERINRAHCDRGVTIESPMSVRVEPGVTIAKDAVIESGARLEGVTSIGAGAVIEAYARVSDSKIGKGVRIKTGSVVEGAEVKAGAQVGPMAHLRPGSVIGANARIGNYVETKKATIGAGSKLSHLTYCGDAVVGKGVNIGCGFITCNYDGEKKSMTVIEDDAFVGSDSQTVAPVTIGKGAYVGSGSTITKNVPPGALALTRSPQTTYKGWTAKKAAAKKKARQKGGTK